MLSVEEFGVPQKRMENLIIIFVLIFFFLISRWDLLEPSLTSKHRLWSEYNLFLLLLLFFFCLFLKDAAFMKFHRIRIHISVLSPSKVSAAGQGKIIWILHKPWEGLILTLLGKEERIEFSEWVTDFLLRCCPGMVLLYVYRWWFIMIYKALDPRTCRKTEANARANYYVPWGEHAKYQTKVKQSLWKLW